MATKWQNKLYHNLPLSSVFVIVWQNKKEKTILYHNFLRIFEDICQAAGHTVQDRMPSIHIHMSVKDDVIVIMLGSE